MVRGIVARNASAGLADHGNFCMRAARGDDYLNLIAVQHSVAISDRVHAAQDELTIALLEVEAWVLPSDSLPKLCESSSVRPMPRLTCHRGAKAGAAYSQESR